jgi:protein KRI1
MASTIAGPSKRSSSHSNGVRPSKKVKLLDESDHEESPKKDDSKITVNKDFARRFEQNKKREEQQRLQEKLGSEEEDESDSEDETEDEDAVFATEEVDDELNAVLTAIKSKDPRIYDENVKWYSEADRAALADKKEANEKPLYLRDYHRQNLLSGQDQDDESHGKFAYDPEQRGIRASLLNTINAGDEEEEEENEDFMIKKPSKDTNGGSKPKNLPDVSLVETNPDQWLSQFMNSRAWVSNDPDAHEFESDDSEEEDKAEEFEQAWNLRFEDPEKSNKVLMTHSRDVAARKSVRKTEGKSARQRAREKEREKKEEAKKRREMERSRLKKLKMDDISQKLERIRESAGLLDDAEDVDVSKWRDLLEADWDDAAFDEQMRKRFDESYYADKDDGMKKPKWNDDEEEEKALALPNVEESGEEEDVEGKSDSNVKGDQETVPSTGSKRKRDHRVISALAENTMDLPDPAPGNYFRYRETSPTSFGMTPLDILIASDAQLNTFAGLKKLTPWRDPSRKDKERKKLGKRARLREWRKDTFGNQDGPGLEAWGKKVQADARKDERAIEKAETKAAEAGDKKKKKRRGKKKSAT